MKDNLQDEERIEAQDPLSLNIDDKELSKIITSRIDASKDRFEKEYDLPEKRKRNKKYYLGNSVDVSKLKDYEGKWQDNIIWESERQLKAVSVSRMPDFIITPGVQGEENQKVADSISKVIDARSKLRERRQVLTIAFKREPIDYFGCIKWFWNPEKGDNGDIDYYSPSGEDIVLDAFSRTNEQSGMDMIAERLHSTLKEMIVKFPSKEKEIIDAAKKDGITRDKDGKVDEKGFATTVHPWEVWFTWYDKVGDKWERIEGVAWKYHDLILHKMKDPNWDWSGEKVLFSYKDLLTEEKVREAILTGQPIDGYNEQTFYRNYFKQPEKPYIFMVSDSLGESPISETSRIDQLILMQYSLDERGKIINEKLRNRTKHVFGTAGGLKAGDIEELDMNDPDQDIFLKNEDVRRAHLAIPPDLPTAQEFKDYDDTRNRMFTKQAVNAVRGELQTDVATSNQIAREGNFSLTDNIVDETITYAAEKMVRADLQLTKLRRIEDDFTEVLGEDGKSVFYQFKRDMINNGMQVIATASGTDKLKAERRALDMAKLKLIDPHTFYKDIGANDPMGRTMKLMLFLQSPAEYTAKYGMGLESSQQMGNALNGEDGQQALLDIQMLQQGQQPEVPQSPQPDYLDTLNQFLNSPDFSALPPQIQELIVQFAQQVAQKAEQGQQSGSAPGQPTQSPAGPQPTAQPQAPTPGDTSQTPVNPPELPQGSPRNL